IWYSDCMAMEIQHIRHIGLFAPHPEEHARFYTDVWGLERVATTADAVFLRGSSTEHFILSLHRRDKRGLHHIAYAMPTDDAVRRATVVLQSAGVRVIEEPHSLDEDGGGYGVRFVDPEGRCIELSSGVVPHSEGKHSTVVQPRSVCHIVVNTPDIRRMTKFYTDVLGFRISDWSGEQMAFLRTESKHQVRVWPRSPQSMDHWGVAAPPSAELRQAMTGEPDRGWVDA